MTEKKLQSEHLTKYDDLPNKPKMRVDKIVNYKKEPGFYYTTIIYDYNRPGLYDLIEYHQKQGYEICYSEDKSYSDDRAFKPDSNKDESIVMTPVYRTTSDGYHEVLMRIPEETHKKLMIERSIKEREQFLKSAGKSAKRMNRVADKLVQSYDIDGGESTVDKT